MKIAMPPKRTGTKSRGRGKGKSAKKAAKKSPAQKKKADKKLQKQLGALKRGLLKLAGQASKIK